MARKQDPPDSQSEDPTPTGPGSLVLRLAGGFAGIVIVAVTGTFLVTALGDVEGNWRVVVAVAMGLAIAWLGIGYFRYLTNPPPPDLAPLRIDPQLNLSYVCEMCGLELSVVVVAKERAPKHCGESMLLIRREEG